MGFPLFFVFQPIGIMPPRGASADIAARRALDDVEWRRLRYMIFQLPDAPGSFSDRVAQIG